MSVPKAQPRGADKRSYYRVHTFLPVRCRRIADSELEGLSTDIMVREASEVSKVDPGLAEWLDRIEGKLDLLLERFETEADVWTTAQGALEVTISGSGIQLPVCEEIPIEADVLLEVTLPGIPKHMVRCIARVAECEVDAKQVTIGAGFTVIAECDRDAIIAHVLEIQRSELRQRVASEE
ncbi:MAG: hypothetical protein GY723_04525 [bacterium]|nr:hypothetical protein [bacterium]MCP5067358.1 hypothetical protein [bacterium]